MPSSARSAPSSVTDTVALLKLRCFFVAALVALIRSDPLPLSTKGNFDVGSRGRVGLLTVCGCHDNFLLNVIAVRHSGGRPLIHKRLTRYVRWLGSDGLASWLHGFDEFCRREAHGMIHVVLR